MVGWPRGKVVGKFRQFSTQVTSRKIAKHALVQPRFRNIFKILYEFLAGLHEKYKCFGNN